MPDTIDLIDVYAVPEIFVDGFAKHISHDGVMTCVGYRTLPEGKTVVLRLVWPSCNTRSAIAGAMEALIGPMMPAVSKIAH